MILPPPLKPGDLIGVAAPAGPFSLDRFEAGLARLEKMGFQTRCPDQIFDKNGFLAGKDEHRLHTLETLLFDPDIKAVICARGGYGAMRILEDVNYEKLKESPKFFIGFSDLTALHLAFHNTIGLVSIHGPVVTSLAEADEETASHLFKLVCGQNPFPIHPANTVALRPGRARGRLLGGNMTLFVHLLATQWMPALDGAVLFLEDVSESPYRVDRMLMTLKLSGVLGRVKGVILGDFNDCGPDNEISAILADGFSDFSGPVLSGFPIGHKTKNLALPYGLEVEMDADAGCLDLKEPYHS